MTPPTERPMPGQVRSAVSKRPAPQVVESGSSRMSRSTQAGPSKAQPVNSRNAAETAAGVTVKPALKPAKMFANFIEYDLSKMSDTKGGFISVSDDPNNRVLAPKLDDPAAGKPKNMTMADWERFKLLERLRKSKSGPYAPGVSMLDADDARANRCRDCKALDIDPTWVEVFGCAVCNVCKKKWPDKYSLLTKTEVREDYLITESELRDEKLLKRLEKPNPHKQHWNSMLLFLRFQVEEYAFGPRKWGSAANLDREFEKRSDDRKKQREKKFKNKLDDLKSRTRTEALRRDRTMARMGTTATQFGDKIRARNGTHEHDWAVPVSDPTTGMQVRKCLDCGLEVEEFNL